MNSNVSLPSAWLYLLLNRAQNSFGSTFSYFSHEVMSDSFGTPWTVARQASLAMGFLRQEYWSRFQFILQGIFLTQGSNPNLLCLLIRQAES